MDPKLLEYMRILSGQPMAGGNPIAEGTQSGIQAARSSMGMDAAQAARARGMAFMTMGNHLAQPGHGPGFGGALKAFNTGFLPSAKAYRGEEQQAEAQNAYIMQQMQLEQLRRQQMQHQERMAEAKLAQRAEEQAALQAHRAAQLGEMRGYHQGKLGLEERKLAEKEGIIPGTENMPGIPLRSLTPGARTAEHKVFNENQTAIKKNENSLKILQEMKKIFNKYPDIGDSYVHLLNDNTVMGKTARSLMNKDKLTAIQELNKLGNDLIFEKIKGMPAKGINIFLEKKIGESVASGNSTKDAADFVIDHMMDVTNKGIKESKNYVNSYKKGYIPIAPEEEIEEAPETEAPKRGSAPGESVQKRIQVKTPDGQTHTILEENFDAAAAKYPGLEKVK